MASKKKKRKNNWTIIIVCTTRQPHWRQLIYVILNNTWGPEFVSVCCICISCTWYTYIMSSHPSWVHMHPSASFCCSWNVGADRCQCLKCNNVATLCQNSWSTHASEHTYTNKQVNKHLQRAVSLRYKKKNIIFLLVNTEHGFHKPKCYITVTQQNYFKLGRTQKTLQRNKIKNDSKEVFWT